MIAAAHAAAPTPAACQAMVDKADTPQSQREVDKCAPWRRQRMEALNQAARNCHAGHKADETNLKACDAADYAAQRFWEETEELESAGNTP
jgi:hypothetical protein